MDSDFKKPYIKSLVGLRGLGALWVVGCHMAISLHSVSKPVLNFISNGWLAVDFFFILSGFVLTYSYAKNFKDSIKINDVYSFLKNRIVRIYPLTFFVLVFMWLPMFLFLQLLKFDIDPLIRSPLVFFYQLFLLNGIGIPASRAGWNGPSWALSSEFFLYCIFPIISAIFSKVKAAWQNFMCIVFIFIGLLILSFLINHGRQFMLPEEFTLIRAGSEFILGCLLCNLFILKKENYFTIFNKIAWLSVLIVVLLSFKPIHPIFQFVFLILFSLIIYGFSEPNKITKSIFENSVLQYIGNLSFAIYIVHYFVLSVIRTLLKKIFVFDVFVNDVVFICVSLFFIIIGSHILYKNIELKAILWHKKQINK
jgi:peptidoglycan/LPS O-acetylase OafA/YrhL